MWCICDIEYFHSDNAKVVPWILGSIKPIQLSNFDFDGYLSARKEFTTDEWIDLLIQSIGFNPEFLREGIESVQGDEILLRLISPLRPGLLEPVEGDDFRYLVMPIRLNV